MVEMVSINCLCVCVCPLVSDITYVCVFCAVCIESCYGGIWIFAVCLLMFVVGSFSYTWWQLVLNIYSVECHCVHALHVLHVLNTYISLRCLPKREKRGIRCQL